MSKHYPPSFRQWLEMEVWFELPDVLTPTVAFRTSYFGFCERNGLLPVQPQQLDALLTVEFLPYFVGPTTRDDIYQMAVSGFILLKSEELTYGLHARTG